MHDFIVFRLQQKHAVFTVQLNAKTPASAAVFGWLVIAHGVSNAQ
jgi:hypothetical protein